MNLFRKFTVVAAILLLTGATACSSRQNDNAQNSEPSSVVASSSDESSMFAIEDNASSISTTSDKAENGQINSALEKIPNFEDMPDDCLLGVKWYGKEIKWTEVNAIANLVRYNITGDPYFLFVPRYAGSQVTISSMSENSPVQILYSEERCADNFGIIINQKFIEPSDPVQIRVTVSYGASIAYYDFIKDGPSVINCPLIGNGTFYTDQIISPQNDVQVKDGVLLAYIDYGHAGFGDFIHFSANMPVDWEKGKATVDAQSYHVIETVNDYAKTIKVWGYYCTNENGRRVDSFLLNYEKLEELKTLKGKKLYRASTSPDSLVYAFMADETLAIIVEMSETGSPVLNSESLYDLQIGNFCDRFIVLDKRQGNEKDPVPDFSIKSYVQLTDGAGKTVATTVNIGDSFLGWTADKIEYYDDSNMIVKFSGNATIKCRLSYSALDEPFGNKVNVYVADESLSLLPSPTNSRISWFILENSEEVIQTLGGKAFDLPDCEIVIDSYTIYKRLAGVSDIANAQAVNYAR